VLVASVPQAGHVYPLLPLARVFAERGDEVLVGSAAGGTEPAAAAGLSVAEVGPDLPEWWRRLAERVPGRPGDGLPADRIVRYFIPRLFAEVGASAMVADLLRLATDWRPDLLVFESYAFAAPLVARLLGIRYAQHTLGLAPDRLSLELAADALSPLWRSYGLSVPELAGLYGDLTLNICPPALEPAPGPAGATILPLRPAALDRAAGDALPGYVPGLADRPIVYGTLGTFANRDLGVFRAIMDGLAGEPVNAVLTVGRNNDPAALRPVPPNVRVERYVPQSLLLPYCHAVINHAGSGTMLGGFGHGLPQLLVPQGADNFINAERAVGAGAALRLLPAELDAAAVAANLRLLLDDPAYRAAAARIAAQIAAMPAAAAVAADVAAGVAAGPPD
jgi:hypothetical protein